jgi:hypothetical protein
VGDLDCPFRVIFPFASIDTNDSNSKPSSGTFVKKGCFTCNPCRGTIRGRSHRRIDVRFLPMAEKEQFDTLHVIWGDGITESNMNINNNDDDEDNNIDNEEDDEEDDENNKNFPSPLVMRVFGAGGTPSLQVLSTTLNYGTSMLGVRNTRELVLKNVGNAETMASIEEEDAHGGNKNYQISYSPVPPVLVAPHSTRIVKVYLDTIKSDDDDDDDVR